MKYVCLAFSLLIVACTPAQSDNVLEQHLWRERVLLVFTPSRDNESFQKQHDALDGMGAGREERDLVVWDIVNDTGVIYNGEMKPHLPNSVFYRDFDVDPDQFVTILIGKDGEVKARQEQSMMADELTSLIDSMPMRQREAAP